MFPILRMRKRGCLRKGGKRKGEQKEEADDPVARIFTV